MTIGQTGTPTGLCSTNQDWAQLIVSNGLKYVVPPLPPATALKIISWSHMAYVTAGQTMKLKVYRQVSGLTYRVIAVDTRPLAGGVLNTFAADIAVEPGDVLGVTTAPGSPMIGCGFGPFTEQDHVSNTDAAAGGQVTFMPIGGSRLNISAVVVPTNTFTVGGVALNKKKGTATLTLNLPNPGELVVSGTGLAEASAAGIQATSSKSVPVAGATELVIKATGKQRKTLKKRGKVMLAPTITYTPTGGSATSQPTSVQLKKKRKKKRKK